MPLYDCGAPDCGECQRAFGPDRSKAIANYEARLRAYAPGHTDLMVTPESLDEFLEKNPPHA